MIKNEKSLKNAVKSTTASISLEYAEEIAIRALTFLAEDEAKLAHFLNLTGLSPDQIRTEAQTKSFLAGVLDHLLSDESLLLVFCSNNDIDPAIITPARHTLDPSKADFS